MITDISSQAPDLLSVVARFSEEDDSAEDQNA
jgi:hypothetical protein